MRPFDGPTRGPKPFALHCTLLGMGTWTPDTIVTSAMLQRKIWPWCTLFGLNLERLTGIRERRHCPPDTHVLDVAMNAVRDLQTKVELNPDRIDTIIYAGVTRAYAEPATAAAISQRLRLSHASAFDVSNACLGFVDALILADALIQAGQAHQVLLVSAEMGSLCSRIAINQIRRFRSIYHHFAGLTLGDGAVAALVSTPVLGSAPRLSSAIRATFSYCSDACVINKQAIHHDKREPVFYADPRVLHEETMKNVPPLYDALLAFQRWDRRDVDLLVPHQTSTKMLAKGAELVEVPIEKTAITVDRFGNMGSVSVPFSLCHALDHGQAKRGDRILVAGIGSGLGLGFIALYA